MERLQNQKNGSGAQAFDFLGQDKKVSNVDAIDQGFTSIQMQELENVEQVLDLFNISCCFPFRFIACISDGGPARCGDSTNCQIY